MFKSLLAQGERHKQVGNEETLRGGWFSYSSVKQALRVPVTSLELKANTFEAETYFVPAPLTWH